METLLRILTIAAIAYIMVVALAYFVQRSLLYFPDQTAIPPAMTVASDMDVIHLKAADGVALQAWYKPALPGRPTILLFHGNGGNLAYRADKARVFLDRGYGVLLAAYRGYGGSGGSPSEAGLLDDGRAAMDFLGGAGVAPGNIVLYGESLGSGVAIAMAAEYAGEYDVAALMLEAPYTSIADVAAAAYPYLPVRWLIRDRFDSVARIGALRVPVLVVHGERDEIIPNIFGRRLFEAANEPKELHIIPGAGHNNLFAAGGRDVELEFLEGLFPED